jgi:AraC-like DNA-binding protein
MHYLVSIGIILALTGCLLIYILKQPLKVSDRLLIAIPGTFVFKFLFDEIFLITENQLYNAIAATFGISTIATCGLYIRYITDTSTKFQINDLLIYIPVPVLMVLILLTPVLGVTNNVHDHYYFALMVIMTAIIIYYFYFCINMLGKHRQLIRAYYSGDFGNKTVNWMVVIITLQIAEFILKGVLALFVRSAVTPDTQIITNEYCYIIETFLLVVLGIWQKSIPVFIEIKEEVVNNPLQADDLKYYQQRIEKFMVTHKPYLDPELTIEKLSELTKIRKLQLSQTLNKGFNKNFFNFIKEYRISHVEALLKDNQHEKSTIMDIAYESGFNSKTGFNRAFKEVTGKTPTDYLEK